MTTRETIRLLSKSIVTRLENQKSIEFAPRLRHEVQEEVFQLIGRGIFTEQDLRDRALAKMGQKADALSETALAESDQYRAAKAVVRATFGDDELGGLYFQTPLKEIVRQVSAFLMRSSLIDEVYEADDVLEKQIVDIVKKFNPANMH